MIPSKAKMIMNSYRRGPDGRITKRMVRNGDAVIFKLNPSTRKHCIVDANYTIVPSYEEGETVGGRVHHRVKSTTHHRRKGNKTFSMDHVPSSLSKAFGGMKLSRGGSLVRYV